jgi:hypothetical protein
MNRKLLLAGVLTLLGLISASSVQAQTIHLSHQGRLLNSSGNTVNGTESMVFNIYSAATGGTSLWTETQTVTVANGFYDVVLGSVNPVTVPFNAPPYYLGVAVGGDAEMTPRHEITSAGHAVFADNSGTAANAANATNATNALNFGGQLPAAFKALAFQQSFDTYSFAAAGDVEQTTFQLTFTIPFSGNALIQYTGQTIIQANSITALLFFVDGNEITNGANFFTQYQNVSSTGGIFGQNLQLLDLLPAGTHTVTLGAESTSGDDELEAGLLSVLVTPQ